MKFAELISGTGFSAYDSERDEALVVTAWGAPAMASDEPVALLVVSQEDALSGVPVEQAVLRADGVVAAAQ